MLAMNRIPGYKICTRALVLLLLVAACLQPWTVLAAGSNPAAKPKHAKISMMDIAVFYAGMVGIVLGVTTGWVSLLMKSSTSQTTPATGNQNK